MAKNNQKCVRMSDEVLKIVMNTKGDGFNEKFENLVIDYHKTIPERQKYKDNIDIQIQDKFKQLKEIENRINGLKSLEFSLDSLRHDIMNINNKADSIKNVSQKKEPVNLIESAAVES